jgi:hypothetical protein
MEAQPVSPPTQKKSSWMRYACSDCITAEHFTYHQTVSGAAYTGKTYRCGRKECHQMINALWKENFVRSSDCSHSNKDILPEETSPIPDPSSRYVKLTQTRSSSKLPQSKVSKQKYDTARTSRGKFTKPARQQVDSCTTNRHGDSNKSDENFHKSYGNPKQVRKLYKAKTVHLILAVIQ